MKYKLGDICFYAKGKVDVTELTEKKLYLYREYVV